MKITAQQFISNTKNKGTFVTVFKHYSENSPQKTQKEGDIYCLLSISGSTSLPAERVCKFVWDGILDGYLYSTSKSTNESLKDSITEGVKKLKSLMKNDKSLEELGVNVNFVLIAQKKEGLYIGNLGENEVFVFKDKELVNITEILGKSKASTAGVALNKGDILVVSTTKVVTDAVPEIGKLENEEDVLAYLNELGGSLKESNGLIFLSYEKEKKANEPIALPQQKPLISKTFIKKPQIQMPKLNMNWDKPKKYIDRVGEAISPFLNKAGKILKEIFKKLLNVFRYLQQKVTEVLGKKKWFKRVASKVSTVKINHPNFSPKGMRIDGYRMNNIRAKRIRLVVIVVAIIVLLALGINFTIKLRAASQVHSQANTIFVNVETLVGKAENLATSDSDSTKTAIYQAKNALKGLPSNMSAKDVTTQQNLNNRILAVEDALYRRVGLTDTDGKLSTFMDTRLAFAEGSTPTDIEIYSDGSGNQYLLVTDKGLNAVYRISLYDKSVEKLTDSDGLIKDPEYVSMGNTGVFVYDKKTGVVRATFDKSKFFNSFVSLSGLTSDDIQSRDIAEFIVLTSSDNVYLLARDENALLKSSFSYENRYGLIYKYVTDASLSSAQDVLADLSLYFLTSSDTPLVRYSYDYVEQKQALNPLTVTGLEGDFSNLSKGYTQESLNYGLYLFDSGNKNLMKFEKPIESGTDMIHPNETVLKQQYVYRGSKSGVWDNVKDIVVDNDESAAYILDGTTIWKVVL